MNIYSGIRTAIPISSFCSVSDFISIVFVSGHVYRYRCNIYIYIYIYILSQTYNVVKPKFKTENEICLKVVIFHYVK